MTRGEGAVRRSGEPPSRSQDLFDWAAVGQLAMLVLHSPGRHRPTFLLIWLGIVGASVALLLTLPKTYEVQVSLQAQKNEVIASLTNRSVPLKTDAPTKQAFETILRHDNLVALIEETDLLNRWPQNRAPLLRLKDAIWARLFPPRTQEEQIEGFVGLLEKSLWVNSPNEGTVEIGIRFPDAQLAYLLVEAAQQSFLEARHVAEISIIADAISILENRAAQDRESLDKTVQRLSELREARAAKLGRRVPQRLSSSSLGPAPDKQTAQLMVQVEGRRRAIADLEEFRRRRVQEIESKLQEQRALYSDNHPTVLDTLQSLAAFRKESPQVVALRQELAPLEAELKQRGLLSEVPLKGKRVQGLAAPGALLEVGDPREEEDPDIEYAKSQVRHGIASYNGILDRIDGAKLEADSAQAAFKYRYAIIRPPQRPRGPIKPKPALIIPASLVAGLIVAIIGTALIDLSSRKIVERWQVEHTIGLPLLGEVGDL
jgi:uncharacterized protein involved in exopolysaccharide biosynthesis